MKKLLVAAILAVMMLGFAQSCVNDQDQAYEQLKEIDSPDPEKVKPPGGNN